MVITNDDDDTLKFTKTRLEKQYDYSCESLSENKAKNLFLQVGDIAILNYK